MNTQHTPGPWKIVTGNLNREFNETSIRPVKSPIKGIILPIASVRYPDHAFGLANARLIAAAPDLLEALQLCEGNIASLLWSTHPKVYSMWLDVVRAAIDKAIGEKA
jgi:hypothetical protein